MKTTLSKEKLCKALVLSSSKICDLHELLAEVYHLTTKPVVDSNSAQTALTQIAELTENFEEV